MKRRNFIVSLIALWAGTKSAIGKKYDAQFNKKAEIINISDHITQDNQIIYLTSSMIIELPKSPETISTLFQFSISKYRFGKSPIIYTNGEKFNGIETNYINVKKDIILKKSPYFILQYTGSDIGWIYL